MIHHLKMKGEKGDLNYYRCAFCKCYHVGHTPGWLKQNIARANTEKRK